MTTTLPAGALAHAPTQTWLALRALCRDNGHGPTLRRLAETRGVSLSTVVGHIERLRSHNLVTWQPGAACTLRPTGLVPLPVGWDGEVHNGRPFHRSTLDGIRQRHAAGEPVDSLAHDYDVDPAAVESILTGGPS